MRTYVYITKTIKRRGHKSGEGNTDVEVGEKNRNNKNVMYTYEVLKSL